MHEFKELVDRLGQTAVNTIGADNLAQLAVFGDPHTHTASVEIVLAVNDWAHQVAAVDSMIQLRGEFFDEVSLDYQVLEADEQTLQAAQDRAESSHMGYVYV